jgi:hypothetical protein
MMIGKMKRFLHHFPSISTSCSSSQIMGPTQDLQQKVCQKYGWSLVYSKTNNNDDDEEGATSCSWRADIGMGLTTTGNSNEPNNNNNNNKRTFVTSDSYKDEKEGKAAVSQLVLDGLASEITEREAVPVKDLMQVFEQTISTQIELLDSSHASTWTRFWDDSPTIVGIDTEGNQISPPVLVQISTEEYVILETPRTSLSADLERLLGDDSIVKVFCDNFSHKDKKSLGLVVDKDHPPETYSLPPIVDLESLASIHLGPVKVARGLGRIVALTMPELNVRIEKPRVAKGTTKGRFSSVSRFALIEQGKTKPLRGLSDLKPREQQYAALDAWCTLQVYHRIQEHVNEQQ